MASPPAQQTLQGAAAASNNQLCLSYLTLYAACVPLVMVCTCGLLYAMASPPAQQTLRGAAAADSQPLIFNSCHACKVDSAFVLVLSWSM
jgi:hypothetical protein